MTDKEIRSCFETEKDFSLFVWAEAKIVRGAWNKMEAEMLPNIFIASEIQRRENAGADRIYKNGINKIQQKFNKRRDQNEQI